MRLVIEATEQVTSLEGVPVRLWMGKTEQGVECRVFVHRIAVHKDQDAAELERALIEQLPPAVAVPLAVVLP